MTQIKKTLSEIFVDFPSEIRDCPFFCVFGGAKTEQKRAPPKKGGKKEPPLHIKYPAAASGRIKS